MNLKIKTAYKKFSADENGVAAIISALVFMTLCIASGVAVEVARISHYKSQLQHAADAAVLAAISQSSKANMRFSDGGDQLRLIGEQGREDLRSFLIENIHADSALHINDSNILPEVGVKDSILYSKISVSAEIDATLAKIIGFKTFTVRGNAEARREIERDMGSSRPLDVHFFLDNSPSMGIGAREQDISNLQKQDILGTSGCAFACHLDDPERDAWYPGNLRALKQAGLKLRIDELRDAVVEVVNDVERYQQVAKIISPKEKVRFSAHSFAASQQQAAVQPVISIFKLSNNYEGFKNNISDASKFDVQKVGYNYKVRAGTKTCSKFTYEDGCIGTGIATADYIATVLRRRDSTNLSLAMKNSNDSINYYNNRRNNIIFIVTDGMANFNNSSISKCYESGTAGYRDKKEELNVGPLGNCVGPIDIDMCEKIKKNGTKIAIVYTKYRDRIKDNNKEFNNIVLPQLNMVEENLKECASKNLFEVSDFHENLYEKMRTIMQRSLMNLKLVN